jgi:hypothetical protein
MIGERYADGLDSTVAAQRVGEASRAVGYQSSWYTSGRLAEDGWYDGIESAVYGIFGHANAGLTQTDEQPPGADDQFIVAGHLGDAWPSNVYAWGDYLPYIDVDFMKLALLAGCYTANSDPDLGSFMEQGRQLGIDSIVGFTGLVYYPASCTTCNYSGNYFWERFAVYGRNGDSVGLALSKAAADLRAKEGDADGWDAWRVGGAAANPSAVRLTPAGDGEWLNSKPFGIDPFDPFALTVTSSEQVRTDDRSYTDHATTAGVSFRLDNETGDLVWLSAPASTRGERALTTEDAKRAAMEFVERFVDWFDVEDALLVSQNPITRAGGDARHRLVWRAATASGAPGPAAVAVEVDRRTGSVVDLNAFRVSPETTAFAVKEADAVEVALEAVGNRGEVRRVERDVWTAPRWVVTIDHGGERTPNTERVLVSGVTGRVVSVTST